MGSDELGSVTRRLRDRLKASIDLPFHDFFTQERVGAIVEELDICYRERIFSPVTTLLMFISQVLVDRCCRAAVSRVVATVAASGSTPPSQETGAYCQARQRLPEGFFRNMLAQTSQAADKDVSQEHLWRGRHRVLVADGSSAQTPDTAANRKEWGLPSGVKPGCGFPVAPLVGLFSLVTGMLVQIVVGKERSSERALFRQGWDTLTTGDVVLGDRGLCCYADMAMLKARGVDAVMRLFNRKPDFRKGMRIGREDHITVWERPKVCPRGMTAEEFGSLPEHMEARELRIRPAARGWRTQELVIVTTLLDARVYTKERLAGLYLRRWEVELDFRHIKTTLGMEMLSTNSPDTVRKEIMTYMIAYNMIRLLMWQAGRSAGEDPLRLSFAGAIQHLKSMSPHLGRARDRGDHARLLGILSKMIAAEKLPNRPRRSEPRVRKRRPKNYRLMTRPRNVLKQEIMNA